MLMERDSRGAIVGKRSRTRNEIHHPFPCSLFLLILSSATGLGNGFQIAHDYNFGVLRVTIVL